MSLKPEDALLAGLVRWWREEQRMTAPDQPVTVSELPVRWVAEQLAALCPDRRVRADVAEEFGVPEHLRNEATVRDLLERVYLPWDERLPPR